MRVFDDTGMNYSPEYKKLMEHRSISEKKTEIAASYSTYPSGRRATGGSSRGDGSKWIAGMSSSGDSPILDHYLLRQNARSAMYESAQARAIVERYSDTVVDMGLRLESVPMAKILQIPPDEAEEWAEDVELRFDMWARSRQSVYGEIMTFYQAQRLAEIHQQRDGEYFVRLHYSDDPKLVNPLQIQFIDPNQIDGYAYTNTYGEDLDQEDGIVRDAAGREKAYKVRILKKTGAYHTVTVPAMGPRSGLRMMLHGFQPEYAGQGRGYSRLSHAVQDFEKLTDFQLAHIQKAINHASINMYTKPSMDNDASDPFDTVPSNQFGASPTVPVDAGNVDPAATLDLSEYVEYNDIPEAVLSRPGVSVFSLRSGEDLKPFPDTAPAEQYDRFVDAFTAHLAASVSMPVEVLLMKFNANYSASRAALVLFWRVAQIWRAELAADLLNPIFEAWLGLEIASGRIQAAGWQDPLLRQAWIANNWIGSPMPDIDPLRHSKAIKEYVEVGATDLDRVARNLNGSIGAANRSKLTRQLTELPRIPWGAKAAGDTPDDEDEKEKKDNG